jgi:hypothetical protein
MEEASRRLGKTIQSKLRQLAEEEAQNGSKLPRTLDRRAFTLLADTISFYAISKISPEWEATKDGIATGSLRPGISLCSHCELIMRFGLPCRHFLALPCQDGAPIPRSLVHPRWWINGEPIQIAEWVPSYRTFALPISPPRDPQSRPSNPYISPRRNEITGLGLQILEARESLTGYARTRYDSAATNTQLGLVDFAHKLQNDDLNTRLPDIVKNPGWNRQFKSHDKVNKRLMTGAEASERDAEQRDKIAAQRTQLQALGVSLIPPTSSFLAQGWIRRRAPPLKVLKEVPDAEAEEAPDAEVEAEAEEAPDAEVEAEAEEAIDDPSRPPPSTAPAALPTSRASRKRAPTMKALEAEKAPKRGTNGGKGRGCGGGGRRVKG